MIRAASLCLETVLCECVKTDPKCIGLGSTDWVVNDNAGMYMTPVCTSDSSFNACYYENKAYTLSTDVYGNQTMIGNMAWDETENSTMGQTNAS